MITGKTITDAQIRELLDDRDPTTPRLSITDRAWCIAALRIPVGKLAKVKRVEARARCAEIYNARAAKDLKSARAALTRGRLKIVSAEIRRAFANPAACECPLTPASPDPEARVRTPNGHGMCLWCGLRITDNK